MVPVSWCVQGWGFQPRLLVTVALLSGADLVGLGTSLGLVGKGPGSRSASLVGRYACSPPHGPRTTAHGPLLQRRETSRPDGFPVTRFMLFEQAVAHQKPKAALTNFGRRDQGHAP